MNRTKAVSNYPNMKLNWQSIESTIKKLHSRELSKDNLEPIFSNAGIQITERQLRKFRANKGIVRLIMREAGV